NFVKGVPAETSYLNVWNIGNSGVNFNGNYRWAADRRRAAGGFRIPLPIAGLLSLQLGSIWRSERWNTSSQILPQFLPRARFDYAATAVGIGIKQIPHYRVELGAGFEYRNRYAKGELPQLYTDNRNVGQFGVEANFRIFDGKYKNSLHLDAFAARPSIIGNARFTGGVAQLSNRITFSKETQTYFDFSLKGGTAQGGGSLPVENYFVLSVDTPNLLRGHKSFHEGQYGNGPMGTDFALFNSDIERRITTVPFFNSLNIPFVTVKWELFFDAG